MHNADMHISAVVTVHNEAQSIERLLDSLAAQTRPPDEIVICDGGSTDGTPDLIAHFARCHAASLPVRLLVETGANISRGRNLAIAAAQGPLIAVTDAGVRLAPQWLEELASPWLETDRRGVDAPPLAAAGFFLADAEGVFLTAMAATVLPLRQEINPAKFLPSSRSVAFLKSAWEAAGGYPEWLDYCEDLVFDLAVNALTPGTPTAFVWRPQAVVYFRPRDSLVAFWKQYYRYARGDGKADLWRKRYALRYAIYLVVTPLLAACGVWNSLQAARWLAWGGLLAGVIAYCMRPWQRLSVLGAELRRDERVRAALLVPVIRAVGDLAKMAGYPVGLWWRFRQRRRKEIDWRQRLGRRDGNVDRRPQLDRRGYF
jgi:glycosyltransferase involved in cell wall biosynthesis